MKKIITKTLVKTLLKLLKTKGKGKKICYAVDIISSERIRKSGVSEAFTGGYFLPKLALKLIEKQIEMDGGWKIEPNDFPEKEKMFFNLSTRR